MQNMVSPKILFLQGLLLGVGTSAIIRRWVNGDSPTGPTDPNVAGGCGYWANDVASTDTCASIESYFGITQAEFVSWNPSLGSSCTMTVGWSYCVEAPDVVTTTSSSSTTSTSTTSTSTSTSTPTTTAPSAPSPTQSGLIPTCDAFYLVRSGDSCYGINTSFNNFTLSQFYSWNPAVKTDCSGLEAGYYVCIGVPGLAPTTTLTMTTTTAVAPTTTSASGPSPEQTGIAANCDAYYYVVSGDTCAGIASAHGITLAEFYAWNPAVGSSCQTLWVDYYVCVGVSGGTSSPPTTTSTATATAPSPTQPGIVSDCTAYYQAVSGDSCSSIVTGRFSYLTVAEFESWNPAVGSSCTNLQAGYYYCVATTDVQPEPGTVSTCTAYHLVASGDTCFSIEQDYGITAADFDAWNPNVGSSCAHLWVGYYVCVGV